LVVLVVGLMVLLCLLVGLGVVLLCLWLLLHLLAEWVVVLLE
jgi:hypothetical protein